MFRFLSSHSRSPNASQDSMIIIKLIQTFSSFGNLTTIAGAGPTSTVIVFQFHKVAMPSFSRPLPWIILGYIDWDPSQTRRLMELCLQRSLCPVHVLIRPEALLYSILDWKTFPCNHLNQPTLIEQPISRGVLAFPHNPKARQPNDMVFIYLVLVQTLKTTTAPIPSSFSASKRRAGEVSVSSRRFDWCPSCLGAIAIADARRHRHHRKGFL